VYNVHEKFGLPASHGAVAVVCCTANQQLHCVSIKGRLVWKPGDGDRPVLAVCMHAEGPSSLSCCMRAG